MKWKICTQCRGRFKAKDDKLNKRCPSCKFLYENNSSGYLLFDETIPYSLPKPITNILNSIKKGLGYENIGIAIDRYNRLKLMAEEPLYWLAYGEVEKEGLEETIIKEDFNSRFRRLIKKVLTTRDYEILFMRYDDYPVEELAKKYNISREKARHLEHTIMKKLKGNLRAY